MKPTYKKAYGVTPGKTDKEHMRNLGIVRNENDMWKDSLDAAKFSTVRVPAGKGDKPRPVNKKNYDANFDGINWKSNQH